jgi:hypothetical protein
VKPVLRTILFLIATLLAPQHLAAQFEAVTALFDDVGAITVYGQGAYLNNSGLRGGDRCLVNEFLCGVGTEVLIDIGPVGGPDVELGLSASYLSGFQAKTPNLELTGAIRSFPTVSAYLTGSQFYVGGGIGIAELLNAQAYDSLGAERGVKGTTFEFGVTGGTFGDVLGIGMFAEVSYRWRRFSSLDYTLVAADVDRVPTNWPRELNFSGPSLAVGLQFRVKGDPPSNTAPALNGRWRLVQIHGDSLPFAVFQAPNPLNASQTNRTQWLDGSIVFTEEGKRYDLVINTRVETLEGANVVGIGSVVRLQSTGVYTGAESIVTLQPSTEVGLTKAPGALTPQPRVLTRVGNDLIMELEGHLLTFAKS